MATVEFRQASRIYDPQKPPAVSRLNLEIADGEFLVLVGPSGCGKSTTLRMLAGLEPVDEGQILIDGTDVTETRSRDRDVAMVFQSYALYPNMTARQNMAFALQNAKVDKATIEERVNFAAKMLELEDLIDRKPSAMSGGQRQRVAMGRAIVRQPKVFLMDEPLSNLDAKLRVSTRAQILQLQRELNTTTVYVTHDQTEAMTMGDRVCVLKKGIIQQVDAPNTLYENPGNTFVATFIGSPAMTLIENVPVVGNRVAGGKDHALDYHMPAEQMAKVQSDRVIVGIRPENWEILGVNQPGEQYGLPVRVDIVEHLGSELYVYGSREEKADDVIAVRGDRITVKVPRGINVDQGDTIYLRPMEGGCVFFAPDTEINYDYL
ncbi:sn-glycerol-3-phosphate ABC transporter ATP-binding protein [Corynebacterium hadale]|uniref:Trehalose import ATP-binding protein SugC n=4 Tax=Corynebacterium TaxID=1716 RepID=A0AB36RP44_9CORY|nr:MULTISPECIES: ATP-binding cassette domain-containing protein [Corynebacterium]PAT03245.1 sn-glycerol-3-phosphate ABC transporter ATP-binding protein [Corynebacterium sp. NML 150383]PAT05510.1 sn-glycerol-3-phosphate ABC transporter ATP-binding protein [Corynebacterium hadale]PAT11091.1 sn-glycerol-3-phosphate ABC transporter ATP-binding protein [Corynebacterium hadale]PAT12842.1 sn-glycerol-3-phosphate ABC transporter ATP-binding protein [Corynebacterium hadale]PAT15814.1 sn-glycerol-3-phos